MSDEHDRRRHHHRLYVRLSAKEVAPIQHGEGFGFVAQKARGEGPLVSLAMDNPQCVLCKRQVD